MSVNVSRVPASAIELVSSFEARLVMKKLLVGAVVGLCVGAVVGGLAFATLAADTTATAFVRLRNPADLTAIAGGASQITPDNQGNTATFVAGEIAYLSGAGFAQAVSRKMAENEPAKLNVAQANQSSVVTISCSNRDGDRAMRTVQTAIDLYGQELAKRTDEQLRAILPKLSEWQQRDIADPTRTQELQRARESVEIQAAEASKLVVLQPPLLNDASSQQWVIGVVLGGLVGGSTAVAAMLVRRRRSGRAALVRTVSDGVDGVLLPVVDLDATRRGGRSDEQTRLARTLYTQCPSSGSDRLILVVGASSASGSAVVAALFAQAAAQTPAAGSDALGSGQHSSTAGESPSSRVVSGGIVGDSTLTPDVIAAATHVVLVAQLDVDTMAQALALHSATSSSAAPTSAVFTYRRRRRGASGRRQLAGGVEESPSAQ